MILYRNGFGLFDQENLAIKFGVKIAPEYATAFSETMPVMTQKNFDEGIQTVESESHINRFLGEQAPALKAISFKHSAIAQLPDFLSTQIKANHDIWVEYHAQEIHAGDEENGDYIHDGLVESFDPASGHVTVIDPMPKHKQRLNISLQVLEKAISNKYGRETGFVVIERK